MPRAAEITKPTATLHKEAMISLINRPASISSRKLFNTAIGDGSAYPGKRFDQETKYHIDKTPSSTMAGNVKRSIPFGFNPNLGNLNLFSAHPVPVIIGCRRNSVNYSSSFNHIGYFYKLRFCETHFAILFHFPSVCAFCTNSCSYKN